MMKIIEVIISSTGETQIQTKGFSGSECQQASRFLEEALGQKVGEKLTPEYHQNQSIQQSNEQQI